MMASTSLALKAAINWPSSALISATESAFAVAENSGTANAAHSTPAARPAFTQIISASLSRLSLPPRWVGRAHANAAVERSVKQCAGRSGRSNLFPGEACRAGRVVTTRGDAHPLCDPALLRPGAGRALRLRAQHPRGARLGRAAVSRQSPADLFAGPGADRRP